MIKNEEGYIDPTYDGAYRTIRTEENKIKMLMSIPSGLMLGARVTTNYRQLKTIYHQRKDHPIYVWRNLCKHMKDALPLFDELCCHIPEKKNTTVIHQQGTQNYNISHVHSLNMNL